MFPHLLPFLQHGAQSSWSPEAQNREKRQEERAPLTSLSHPGDAEAGEAEEHSSDERDEQVHVPGPHGADSTAAAATRSLARIAEHAATTHAGWNGHARCLRPGRATTALPQRHWEPNSPQPPPTHPHAPAPFPSSRFGLLS